MGRLFAMFDPRLLIISNYSERPLSHSEIPVGFLMKNGCSPKFDTAIESASHIYYDNSGAASRPRSLAESLSCSPLLQLKASINDEKD